MLVRRTECKVMACLVETEGAPQIQGQPTLILPSMSARAAFKQTNKQNYQNWGGGGRQISEFEDSQSCREPSL